MEEQMKKAEPSEEEGMQDSNSQMTATMRKWLHRVRA